MLCKRTIECARRETRTIQTTGRDVKARLASLERRPLPPKHKPSSDPTPSPVRLHKEAMKESFPSGWNPPRKLSRDAMDGLRALHAHRPEQFTTPVLADKFKISPEAVRRILKSKWRPMDEERRKLQEKEKAGRRELRMEARSKEWDEVKRTMRRGSVDKRQERDGFDLR